MTIGKAWDDLENAALVALYFWFLARATAGDTYNKRAAIRGVQGTDETPGPLHARSKGSIEAKLMNCTACHRDIDPDAVTMDSFGYRALSRYQGALKAETARQLEQLNRYEFDEHDMREGAA